MRQIMLIEANYVDFQSYNYFESDKISMPTLRLKI